MTFISLLIFFILTCYTLGLHREQRIHSGMLVAVVILFHLLTNHSMLLNVPPILLTVATGSRFIPPTHCSQYQLLYIRLCMSYYHNVLVISLLIMQSFVFVIVAGTKRKVKHIVSYRYSFILLENLVFEKVWKSFLWNVVSLYLHLQLVKSYMVPHQTDCSTGKFANWVQARHKFFAAAVIFFI